jgi:NADH pyrophosphatase NudC (nudix superfamily)
LACPASDCGFVHWNNPIPVVAGLVQWGDRYVLARNSAWPPALFSILTGFLDEREAPEVAIVREIREELGVQTESIDLIGLFPLPRNNQLIVAYALRTTGEPVLSDEIAEIKLVSPDELATFDFGPLELTRDIVLKWLHRGAVPGS